MYYQKESKGLHNDYYKQYAEHLSKEINDTDMLSTVIKVLAIVFLLTLIIFGYIFVSNQYYLSHSLEQTEIPKEEVLMKVNTIESVENVINKDNKKLSSRDVSKIVQMVMLKMNTLNENEIKTTHRAKVHQTIKKIEPSREISDTKVIIREVDTRSKNIKFIVVKKGDTLSTIARRVYGKNSSYKKIVDANRKIIKDTNKIFAGQRLRIPLP